MKTATLFMRIMWNIFAYVTDLYPAIPKPNKINLKSTSIFIVLFFISGIIKAEITLPSIFGDHMVLQQQTNVAIWGKASPGKTVNVCASWDKRNYITRADNTGKWKLKVKTPKAGGPYELTISDGIPLHLKEV